MPQPPLCYKGHRFATNRHGRTDDRLLPEVGIDFIPTVFLIDAEGTLYSTEAHGQLEALDPKLLKN